MELNDATPSGKATIALILDVFRLNGRLLTAADRLVSRFGLTSARWQVLGAIALAPAPEPVARLARNMGLTRQGVQRVVNELLDEGIVALQENPHHRRARLVLMTEKGNTAFAAAVQLQIPWVNALAEDIEADRILAASSVLELLRSRLEVSGPEDEGSAS
jgi:DNA-binding MarR family transcriptional regulator